MKSTQFPLTVSDLESAPDDGNRYEVIEGELYVSAAPSFFHQRVLLKLAVALDVYLRDHPAGVVAPGVGVIFDELNGVIPDLVFLTHETQEQILRGGRLTAAPEIVVEILSPGAGNEKRDRVLKRHLYSAQGVHEYWIVDADAKTVEVYRQRKDAGLKLAASLHSGDELTSSVLPGFRISLAQLFAD